MIQALSGDMKERQEVGDSRGEAKLLISSNTYTYTHIVCIYIFTHCVYIHIHTSCVYTCRTYDRSEERRKFDISICRTYDALPICRKFDMYIHTMCEYVYTHNVWICIYTQCVYMYMYLSWLGVLLLLWSPPPLVALSYLQIVLESSNHQHHHDLFTLDP